MAQNPDPWPQRTLMHRNHLEPSFQTVLSTAETFSPASNQTLTTALFTCQIKERVMEGAPHRALPPGLKAPGNPVQKSL